MGSQLDRLAMRQKLPRLPVDVVKEIHGFGSVPITKGMLDRRGKHPIAEMFDSLVGIDVCTWTQWDVTRFMGLRALVKAALTGPFARECRLRMDIDYVAGSYGAGCQECDTEDEDENNIESSDKIMLYNSCDSTLLCVECMTKYRCFKQVHIPGTFASSMIRSLYKNGSILSANVIPYPKHVSTIFGGRLIPRHDYHMHQGSIGFQQRQEEWEADKDPESVPFWMRKHYVVPEHWNDAGGYETKIFGGGLSGNPKNSMKRKIRFRVQQRCGNKRVIYHTLNFK